MHRRTFLLTSLLPALLAGTAEATEIGRVGVWRGWL